MSLKSIITLLNEHKEEIKNYGVKKLAIFGSHARGEEKVSSDVDILIEFDPKKGLFVFVDLKSYLESLLGKNVDLVTKKGLHPALKDKILKEAKNAF